MIKHYSRVYTLFFVSFVCLSLSAQISKDGYSLVYSSETPEAASVSLALSAEELQNCTGDFSSIENMERNWEYCAKAGSGWTDKRDIDNWKRLCRNACNDQHPDRHIHRH